VQSCAMGDNLKRSLLNRNDNSTDYDLEGGSLRQSGSINDVAASGDRSSLLRKNRASFAEDLRERAKSSMADMAGMGKGSVHELAKDTARQSFSYKGDQEELTEDNFLESKGLTDAQVEVLRLKWGYNELEEKKTPLWLVFLQLLTPPMPMMIWIAIATEIGINNMLDAGILFFIQMMNASISFYETTKAGDAVAALKNALKPQAMVKRNGKTVPIDARLLVPNDLVFLASGGSIPADCFVHEGEIEVDQAALTGESLPVVMQTHAKCLMGSNVVKGHIEATVVKTGKHTFFGEAAELLKGQRESSNLEKTLISIIMVLVFLSLTLCSIAFWYLMAHDQVDFIKALSFTVVLMVASIPLAIEIVCTTTLALGSRQMAVYGAIVSRLSAIEDLAGLNILCSDKTGTLTLNKMEIQKECPTFIPGEDQRSILRYAAMAAKWREPPRDALDTLVLKSADLKSLDDVEQLKYVPFDPTFKRTEGTVREKNGKEFKVTKGAPDIIMALMKDQTMKDRFNDILTQFGERGVRCLAVARTDINGEWQMAGLLTFLDPPRPDTKATIAKARDYGVSVKMITGDHTLIARETAKVLDMGHNILPANYLPNLDEKGEPPADLAEKFGQIILETDGFAQMFPSHKYIVIEALRRMGYRVGMTGDGVNDAPALKKSDVGIAVHGATDTARAAADIVLTQEGLSTIVDGIVTSREIFQRMNSFLTYRIAATLQLLTFFFVALLTLKPSDYQPSPLPPDWLDNNYPWPDYFQMPVLMLMLITLLNDGTLISIGYDNVMATQYPNKWNMPILFLISSTLGAVAMLSSLFLLWCALDSWRDVSVFQQIGIGGVSYGHVTTIMYLKVSVTDFLTLFSARTNDKHFCAIFPNKILLFAGGTALSLSTTLASLWPVAELDGVKIEGLGTHGEKQYLLLWVWGYCLGVWVVQDILKVTLNAVLKCTGMYVRDVKPIAQSGDNQLTSVVGGGGHGNGSVPHNAPTGFDAHGASGKRERGAHH